MTRNLITESLLSDLIESAEEESALADVAETERLWGACSTEKKKLWFNLQLAQKPVTCLDYIILHELTIIWVERSYAGLSIYEVNEMLVANGYLSFGSSPAE